MLSGEMSTFTGYEPNAHEHWNPNKNWMEEWYFNSADNTLNGPLGEQFTIDPLDPDLPVPWIILIRRDGSINWEANGPQPTEPHLRNYGGVPQGPDLYFLPGGLTKLWQ